MIKPIPKDRLLDNITRKFIDVLKDESIERQLPAQWSYMHLFSSIQIGKVISMKRGLDIGIAVLCIALHDIATVLKGIKENHAHVGAELIDGFLEDIYQQESTIAELPDAKLHVIRNAVSNHSDKGVVTEAIYDEFTKDVDAFDRHLHSLVTKDDAIFRVERVQKELNID